MKLSITASDKPNEQEFNYSLNISDRVLLFSTLAICGTIALCSSMKAVCIGSSKKKCRNKYKK